MALTRALPISRYINVAVASVSAGDVVAKGGLLGIAMNDTDGNGDVTIDVGFDASVHDLSVKGTDDDGNQAVAIGDTVYKDGSDVNVDKANGTKLGIALEAVTGGATTTIRVLLLPGPGELGNPQNNLKSAVISGGAAGAHTVTGISATGDRLASVVHNTAGTLADLTSEFSISADDTIDNTSGTDTSSDQLLVLYEDRTT